MTVRSVSDLSRARLAALKDYTRLTYGSLLDDCVESLWNEYLDEGHMLPQEHLPS